MTLEEIWKPIAGYEGFYEISNLGNIRSLDRYINVIKKNGQHYTSFYPGKLVNQGYRYDGYAIVVLSKQGKSDIHCVHRLLAEAFIPNPDNLSCVNHIDLDKTNNSLSNLEWSSYTSNNRHAVSNYANPQAIQIYCKETGKVYASMGTCDRELNLKPGTTWEHINNGRRCDYHLSKATPEQISEYQKEYIPKPGWTFNAPRIGERKYPIREIKCINTQQVFNTLKSAAEAFKIDESDIRESIRNRRTCKGLTFYYTDDPPENEDDYVYSCEHKPRIGEN